MLVGRRRTESSVRLPAGNQENCSAARLDSGRSNAWEIRAVHSLWGRFSKRAGRPAGRPPQAEIIYSICIYIYMYIYIYISIKYYIIIIKHMIVIIVTVIIVIVILTITRMPILVMMIIHISLGSRSDI